MDYSINQGHLTIIPYSLIFSPPINLHICPHSRKSLKHKSYIIIQVNLQTLISKYLLLL